MQGKFSLYRPAEKIDYNIANYIKNYFSSNGYIIDVNNKCNGCGGGKWEISIWWTNGTL